MPTEDSSTRVDDGRTNRSAMLPVPEDSSVHEQMAWAGPPRRRHSMRARRSNQVSPMTTVTASTQK